MDGEAASAKEKIVNAAIKIFSQCGYEKTSTNQIAAEAGVSKGLVFHYFSTKKELFLSVYRQAVLIYIMEICEKLDPDQRDFLLRIQALILLKFELMKKHPDIFDFIKTAYLETSLQVKEEIAALNRDLLDQSFGLVYENIDYSLFKPDLDRKSALATMLYTLEKWSENFVRQNADKEWNSLSAKEILDALAPFLSLFRVSFYKEDSYGKCD